jgi:hypothetical protein
VLITDGYDEHSTTSFEDALAAAKAARVTVYVVAIGGVAGISMKGEKSLRRLAKETGGRFFLPANDNQLATVHSALADDVQNRYLLIYTPSNQTIDGSWRNIAVSCGDPRYVVKTRTGYFAPKPGPIRPRLSSRIARRASISMSPRTSEVVENGVGAAGGRVPRATQPVSIVLALDNSGSMREKEADVVAAARVRRRASSGRLARGRPFRGPRLFRARPVAQP